MKDITKARETWSTAVPADVQIWEGTELDTLQILTPMVETDRTQEHTGEYL